ncbi:DUF4418 family protein [uncultured Ruminococcus sp.]|uniref:DUF4418 family protein n=1 Tax=uncultured Ruminococcus sp. TaxID=165186 RepID=UPI000ECE1EBD|nr:DUF4418 family protein [uncultured Ruminococcus sp.]HCJ42381.1 DUF4418 domain-containing protein [Ruminococcus sp.]
MKRKAIEWILGVLLLGCSLCLSVGVKLVFHACGPKDDGSFMTCHWAEQAVLVIGGAMTVISLLVLFVTNGGMRRGLALALAPLGIGAALIPNTMIKLCMMNDMHCHAVMKPAVIIFGITAAVLGAVYALVGKKD